MGAYLDRAGGVPLVVMSERFVYLNGRVVPASEATVSVFDTGFLHGASVFTTLLAHNGRPFRLDKHLERLSTNADRIGLNVPVAAEELTAAVEGVLEANGLSEARIRITLSPGPVGTASAPTTVVTADEVHNDPDWYTKGLGVIVSGVQSGQARTTSRWRRSKSGSVSVPVGGGTSISMTRRRTRCVARATGTRGPVFRPASSWATGAVLPSPRWKQACGWAVYSIRISFFESTGTWLLYERPQVSFG